MKKIAILGLHLNYGGVEQAIINQANSLCDNYEVEIAVTYKINEEPAFFVNPKVKIKYLTDCLPNREEFKKNIKERKFLKAFKEGLKSIKTLYLKYHSMKKYIKNSDADIIISSRIGITKILNKFSPDNCITITEEHCHHNNNKKYINNLKRNCKNIDYLVSVSQELNDFYSKEIKHIQCEYIPNALNFWPIKNSKLNNKNLISVGRLSKEKGFSDLIDVFKIIYDKDKNYHLDIIGDGIEYNNLLDNIKGNNLESAVKLHGFQNREYINNCLANSSLYIMTSYEESFGIVLIEAGAFGIPQVAFDSAQGANEIISNNKSGYLIKNRDKNEMARKIMSLIDDKKKLKSFGDDAKKIAETFSFDNTKEKWLKFISNLRKKNQKKIKLTKLLTNKYISLLLIIVSYLLIDIPLRYFSIKSIYFYSIRNIAPLLFSFSIIIFNLLIIKSLSKKSSVVFYIISIMFNYILALIQFFHYKVLGNFFTFSELFLTQEGLVYINSIFKYINLKFIALNCIFLLVVVISIISLLKGKKEKTKFKKKLIIFLICVLLQIIGIISLYHFNNNYDKNSNMSPIYNYFKVEVPYRSIQVLGVVQYNLYDIIYYYTNSIINKINVKKNYKIISEYFDNMPDYEEENEYTNIFKDKNLIYILLESGDNWLIDEKYMPTLYNMSKEGWNFTNRYAPFFYGGYTFNAEFSANTGIYLTDNFEESIDNYFPYSLPNLFKKAGYTVNSFHMNNDKFYERGTYHKAFGYSNYYGGYNVEEYLEKGYNYVDDVNWILNEETYDLLVPKNQKFMSFLITYSMHLPYFNNELCDEAIRNGELNFDKWDEREEVCLRYLSTRSDLMLKELLKHLEDDKLLDDTVIIMFADHDTYGFSDKEMLAKVKGTDNLYLQQKVPLIIWSKNIKHQDIDILMDTADLVPTIANLFGLEYENRNYLSTDVFSNHHDDYIYFQYGYVLNSDNELFSNEAIGNRMINYNEYILSTDYYRRQKEDA